jgi:hypothetical protein
MNNEKINKSNVVFLFEMFSPQYIKKDSIKNKKIKSHKYFFLRKNFKIILKKIPIIYFLRIKEL